MELVDREDIPRRVGRGGTSYPWEQWLAQLQNGKALKLERQDMPEGSSAYTQWGNTAKRRGALHSATRLGML